MSITIKDCPFCGNDNVEISEECFGEFSIECPECRCIGPICGSVMESIAEWNNAPRQPKEES